MTDQPHPDVQALRVDVVRLTHRVEELEAIVLQHQGDAPDAVSPPVAQPSARALWQEPTAPFGRPPQPPPPPAPRPARATPPAPPRDPINWGKVGEQLFAARTLAWAGGVATALGVVLLFVMAASRGWVTAPMRVGVGVLVSLVMLGAAIELDRRTWRADAILAAAGVGIAGLYASLWASAQLYHFFGAAPATALAAAIAAVAVAVAIRIHQEPLAVFGISGAMLAPFLVSHAVTAPGVLFAAVMMAATLPLYLRLRWRWLVTAGWLIGAVEAGALMLVSANHTGPGLPVVAAAATVGLLVCMLFLVELLPASRARVSPLGWAIASTAFTLSVGDAFLFAGERHVHGHWVSGLALIVVTAMWALLAAAPVALGRRHADLTDILAAFALTAAAATTGLLAGGPALVCGWAAESAALVVAAERISRRSRVRHDRITVAAGVYLALATARTLLIVVPTHAHLAHLGAGSGTGTVALAALAIAGIVYCYAVRWVPSPARVSIWALPALAIGYLPAWALAADRAVLAYAVLAAALLGYRRSRFLIDWLGDATAIEIAAGWWLAGAAIALAVTSPLHDLVQQQWAGLGARHGLIDLAALVASACVSAWSLRRPARPHVEYALLVPLATLAYLVAEAMPTPYAIWAWLGVAGALAGMVHVPAIGTRLSVRPLLAGASGLLVLGVVSAWAHDNSLRAVHDHGVTTGWESIAVATAAALLLATAMPDPRRRTSVLWLPYLLAAQLAAMLLPGQYPLVVAAALAAAAGGIAVGWPALVRSRLDRGLLAGMGLAGSLVVSAVVLLIYETPRMLFQSSHTPASGLAAALAATASLFVAAAAIRRCPPERAGTVAGVRAATALVYLAGAATLWTLAAAILGAAQIPADAASVLSIHDRFQQGHVAVSISWVLVGLVFVVLSLRGDRRSVRIGGIALLFVALAKLFLYDLAFLTAMARAVSFITTGSVLLLAALLLHTPDAVN